MHDRPVSAKIEDASVSKALSSSLGIAVLLRAARVGAVGRVLLAGLQGGEERTVIRATPIDHAFTYCYLTRSTQSRSGPVVSANRVPNTQSPTEENGNTLNTQAFMEGEATEAAVMGRRRR